MNNPMKTLYQSATAHVNAYFALRSSVKKFLAGEPSGLAEGEHLAHLKERMEKIEDHRKKECGIEDKSPSGMPYHGMRSACVKCGGEIEFVAAIEGKWCHLVGPQHGLLPGDNHNAEFGGPA